MKHHLATVLTLASVFAAAPLVAHHSPSAIFDMSKVSSWSGTLTKVNWVNPHINVSLDVKQADGSVETWNLESNPPSWFKQVGLSRADLAKGVGQIVTVDGVQARDGTKYGYMFKIKFADGDSLELQLKNPEEAK